MRVLEDNPEYANICVLMSGDSGFYSGTKKLLPLLSGYSVKVLPGISSPVYLCSQLGISYENIKYVSLHGRDANLADAVRKNALVFALVGGDDGIGGLCERLVNAGLSDVTVHVGERLSYPDEKIISGRPDELLGQKFESLSCALIVNENPELQATHGLPDEAFLRNMEEGKPVPMTKMEVRSVSLSKLQLSRDSICYDVGAGTGSVAIEMARTAADGKVFAIEKRPEALELLEKNMKSFGLENMEIVAGSAPEALADLPAPSHVFIGGTSGNAGDIIACVLGKNPNARIVATAVTLESVGEMSRLMGEFDFSETEVVSLSVAKGKNAGAYHLMTGQNPVYIFTMQKKGK